MVKHNGRCPQSPTGAHWWVMSWPEPCVYIGTCKWCGQVKHEDAALGMKPMNLLPDGTTYFRGASCELRMRGKGVADA